MQILDGKKVAEDYKAKLKIKIDSLKADGIVPGLGIVLVEGDAASNYYTNALVKLAANLGVRTVVKELAASVSEVKILEVIDEFNNDDAIDGILPMMPMPGHLDDKKIAERVLFDKDVDAINPVNAGMVATGKSRWVPCTPRAVMAILDYYNIALEGRRAVILGRSNVVGKPLAHLLLARNATITVCHSKTNNLKEVSKEGDIVIAAIGRAEFVTKEMISPGAVVIDVGINEIDGKMVGDVKFSEAAEIAAAITPVPGGVGAVSNTMVMDAVLRRYY